MAYETLPPQPTQGQPWNTWGAAADANLRQVVTDLTSLPDLTTIYEAAKA